MSEEDTTETPTLEQLRQLYGENDICANCDRDMFIEWLMCRHEIMWFGVVEEAFSDHRVIPPPWQLDGKAYMYQLDPQSTDAEELRTTAAQDWARFGTKSEDDQFGACPACNTSDGYLNVERDHWGVCHTHKVKWFIGSDRFDTWKRENEETWEKNAQILSNYREINEGPEQQ